MSYHGTDKLKPRFNDETRGGKNKKKKKPLAPTPTFPMHLPSLEAGGGGGTMEFLPIIIILKFGRFGGCLFTCLIPSPGSGAWLGFVVEHPLGGCAS